MSDVEDELFLMTNLYPASTGLPMVIWVRPELWRSSTTCRIKVSMAHGTRPDPRNLATVGVRPTPHLVAGQLSTADLQAVTEWIRLNEKTIIDHWNGLTDGVQLGQQLKRLPAPPQRPATRHTITGVRAYGTGSRLLLRFDDDDRAEPTDLVDVAVIVAQGGVFEPLRDPNLFMAVEIGPHGRSVVWHVGEDVVDLCADALWLMARPNADPA